MFQSRGGALFFVGLTLVGVAGLVGTEETDGAIASATAQFEQQGEDFREQAEAMSNPGEPVPVVATEAEPAPPEDLEFASDEDLIVDPTGIDPTPVIEDPAEGEVLEVETGSSGPAE
ncbi:hypothetical protein [Parerythrobacter aestuarii]|uniref:hypothetical protein n=1 Tax=Parerythrobacter aestuarii TaxID=3020909 RepID=UPI0024DE653D|nr:hypothetical protein [Parerythrobacter aestuarii]